MRAIDHYFSATHELLDAAEVLVPTEGALLKALLNRKGLAQTDGKEESIEPLPIETSPSATYGPNWRAAQNVRRRAFDRLIEELKRIGVAYYGQNSRFRLDKPLWWTCLGSQSYLT